VLPLGFLALRTAAPLGKSCCGRGDGHAGRGGFRHEINRRRSQAVGLVDEVADGVLQFETLGGEGEGG
jgi:hypothetical protein